MIRGNETALANAPAVVEDAPPAKGGFLKPRNLIIIIGAVAWLAVLGLFVVPRLTAKPAPAEASAPTAAAAAKPVAAISEESAAGGVTAPPKAVQAPMLPIVGRVFNLSGTGAGFKYVKLSIGVQFEDEGGKFGKAKGEGLKKLQDDFAAENAGTLAAFNDILTSTVTSRTAADLSTTQGKEALRTELISKFNKALAAGGSKERVTYVIFSDFVMQ
jgi:flagellar basal body-associated protein FliL